MSVIHFEDDGNHNWVDITILDDAIMINQSILYDEENDKRLIIDFSYDESTPIENDMRLHFQTYEKIPTEFVELANGEKFPVNQKGGYFDPSRKMPTKEEREEMCRVAREIMSNL